MNPMEEIIIQHIALHKVGNTTNKDSIRFSKDELDLEDDIRALLKHYFLSPFKTESRYHFSHESDLNLNEVFFYARQIFKDSDTFFNTSISLAKHLHAQSTHPKIKFGEFYVVLFDNCVVEGRKTKALGLFKSESRETYLKVVTTKDNYNINSDEGININKLDKGCLIFNLEEENGFIVEAVDHLNKTETHFWFDEFLHLVERKDAYYQTDNALAMTKKFVTSYLPHRFDMDRTDEAEILNNSARYFREHDTFDLDAFSNEVLDHPDLANTFKSYKTEYEQEYKIQIDDHFDISDRATKRQAKNFKSVLKLDKNFSLYIHGDRRYIEKGRDEEKNMNFYKLYFNEEN
jgi:hypothetical protein